MKQLPKEGVQLTPYPFQIYWVYFNFFGALYKLTCDLASSFPSPLEGEQKLKNKTETTNERKYSDLIGVSNGYKRSWVLVG